MASSTLPDFGTYLLTNLMADISNDVLPDAQAVLSIVISGGYQALLLPTNALTVQSFLVKLEADGLAVGNDLSKQIAQFVSLWLSAKVASVAPAPAAAPAAPAAA